MVKLSILICTIPSRAAMLGRLKTELWSQILPYADEVKILTNNDPVASIGTKRNELLELAKEFDSKYVAFFDDDDWPSKNYIKYLMEAVESDCDCASLKGIITFDDSNPEVFEHSLKYDSWKTNPLGSQIRYERFPNHLNACKLSIASQIKYPEKNHGEDFDWSTLLHESGLLKTEHYISEVIYYYRFIQNKK